MGWHTDGSPKACSTLVRLPSCWHSFDLESRWVCALWRQGYSLRIGPPQGLCLSPVPVNYRIGQICLCLVGMVLSSPIVEDRNELPRGLRLSYLYGLTILPLQFYVVFCGCELAPIQFMHFPPEYNYLSIRFIIFYVRGAYRLTLLLLLALILPFLSALIFYVLFMFHQRNMFLKRRANGRRRSDRMHLFSIFYLVDACLASPIMYGLV